jgi:hypothetical protein
VADATTRTIRTTGGTTLFTFPTYDIPAYIENDSANRLFVVTTDSYGAKAKLWRLDFSFGTAAGQCTVVGEPTILANLHSLLSGPYPLYGLASSKGIGVAVGPSNYAITQVFKTGEDENPCQRDFNFGYHLLTIDFTECDLVPSNYELKIVALKSLPSQVEFSGPFVPAPPKTIEGVRYSPMGGHVIQYVIDGTAPGALFLIKYGFFTQEALGTPGVARAGGHSPTDVYTESTGTEFWDVGALDAAAGERDRDFSKRVVFNAELTRQCTFGEFEQPFRDNNPLFNSNQTMKVAAKAKGPNCDTGVVRISIVKIINVGGTLTYIPQNVTSKNDVENIMRANNGKFSYSVDLSSLDTEGATASNPARFLLTMWGDVAGPISREFRVTK